MRKILVIEDDQDISGIIKRFLEQNGYEVFQIFSAEESMKWLKNNKPDLILLDLMLSGLSGEDLIKQINDIPVIVVSAKSEVDNKVELLLNGASDFVSKPFHLKELRARIIAVLRNHAPVTPILSFQDLSLNTDSYKVTIGPQSLDLTRSEFLILKLLLQHRDQVISKSFLIDQILWETGSCSESSLKTHISHLRKKLKDISGKDYIESVWGIGFKLKDL